MQTPSIRRDVLNSGRRNTDSRHWSPDQGNSLQLAHSSSVEQLIQEVDSLKKEVCSLKEEIQSHRKDSSKKKQVLPPEISVG